MEIKQKNEINRKASVLSEQRNSTEMTIHIGYLRAGWRGLIAAGVADPI
jgi:hypothetical protein